jgi:hypothetical protein
MLVAVLPDHQHNHLMVTEVAAITMVALLVLQRNHQIVTVAVAIAEEEEEAQEVVVVTVAVVALEGAVVAQEVEAVADDNYWLPINCRTD